MLSRHTAVIGAVLSAAVLVAEAEGQTAVEWALLADGLFSNGPNRVGGVAPTTGSTVLLPGFASPRTR